jgi:hypothetical protein
MKLKLCFLTPEQEQAMKEADRKYTVADRESLGLLVNGIQNLVSILEIYMLDSQGEASEDQLLTVFQTLGHLIEPVQEYFADTFGTSLNYKEDAAAGE